MLSDFLFCLYHFLGFKNILIILEEFLIFYKEVHILYSVKVMLQTCLSHLWQTLSFCARLSFNEVLFF